MIPPAEPWPEYCCAILRDDRGRYLLERRPASKLSAPGLLVCFGGRREPHESPEACLLRELQEELGWTPPRPLRLCTRLLGPADRQIAWFFRGEAPANPNPQEPGVQAVWLEPGDIDHLAELSVSPWHILALSAEHAGRPIAYTTAKTP